MIRIASNAVVLIIGFRIRVTTHTGKFCIVGWVGMTICTGIPLTQVLAAVNRKILPIMVKTCGGPGRFGVTSGAVC